MEDLISSGRVVDLILAVIVLEALFLSGLAVRLRWRLPIFGILMNLAAGAALLLALRSVLTDGGWPMTAGWLAAAFLAHLADLIDRVKVARKKCREKSQ